MNSSLVVFLWLGVNKENNNRLAKVGGILDGRIITSLYIPGKQRIAAKSEVVEQLLHSSLALKSKS